jgi:hypothetical protein
MPTANEHSRVCVAVVDSRCLQAEHELVLEVMNGEMEKGWNCSALLALLTTEWQYGFIFNEPLFKQGVRLRPQSLSQMIPAADEPCSR